MERIKVIHGDCLVELPKLEADSFDSCVCDPPYHLQSIHKRFAAKGRDETSERYAAGAYGRHATGFMGKKWDGGDIAFRPETWVEVLRVLKPGAHLVAFGGTRTFHRMACAIEDAGFEIRDTLCWLYGSGFPKSHDVSKGIDKAAGVERKVVASGAAVKRMIPGADQDKTGSWVKDNGREYVPNETAPATDAARQWSGWGTALKPAYEPIILARKPLIGTVVANVLRHGTGGLNIDECRVGLADGEPLTDGLAGNYERMDSGTTDGSWGFKRVDRPAGLGRWPANVCHDGSREVLDRFPATAASPPGNIKPSASTLHAFGEYQDRSLVGHTDSGSVARFFYTAKADKGDRLQSKHPTVKPVDLMCWLARLITPPKGLILDPFAGSGTTGMAAMAEGFSATLIELDEQYVADINRRIHHVAGADTPLLAERKEGQGTLFDQPTDDAPAELASIEFE